MIALIARSVVAQVQHSWRAFTWGAVIVPCVAIAVTLIYLVVRAVPVLPALRADVEAVVRGHAPGPLRIEVYDRGLRLLHPDGTVSRVSGVTRVTTQAQLLRASLGDGAVAVVPGGVTAADLSHLVGLPEVQWPEGSERTGRRDRV